MKLRHQFKIEFTDTNKPPRHKETITIEVPCECSFPKADEAALELKSRDKALYDQYKKEVIEKFIKKTTDVFFDKFDQACNSGITKNYKELMSVHEKVNYTDGEWQEILKKFVESQKPKVKSLFIKMLADVTEKVAEKSMAVMRELDKQDEEGRERIATLTPKEAFANFKANYGLKFEMDSSKFPTDHLIDRLSKKGVQEASAERYWKNGTRTCSWTELSVSSVLSKAASGKAVPTVYNGKQQLSVTIKAVEKVGIVTPWDPKKDGKNGKPSDLQEARGKTPVTVDVSEKTKEFMLVGNYEPEKGIAKIYHYAPGSSPDNPEMLDKYLKWFKKGDKVIAWKEKN
ncbi:hypothetical protein EI613_17320 [Azospirillum sp. 412522]|nr:hypothetical protein [Azospirillum sp. 412522]MBY6263660.1 hypothetical protein [Azospirillum sp. 412522]